MARRVFPAGTVTNTTGAPLRLTFHVTSTTGRRETDLWTVDGSNNLVERIPNGVILTNSSGAYSAFAGPDDIDTLHLQPHTGAARTSILATARVASGVTEDNATYAQRTVVDARERGVTCDGVTDDSAAIATAIAALHSGETLMFPHGKTILANQGISVTTLGGLRDVTLDFNGCTLSAPTYSSGPVLKVGGAITTAVTTATGTVNVRTYTVNVASGAAFAADDMIVLRSLDEVYNPDRPTTDFKGEINRVRSVSGNVLTLESPTRDTYDATGHTLYVDKLTPVKNITVKNLTVTGGGVGLSQNGPALYQFDGGTFSHCVVIGTETQGIQGVLGVNLLVDNCRAEKCNKAGVGYGIHVTSVEGAVVRSCKGWRNRHSIDAGPSGSNPPSRNVTIVNNEALDDDSAGISTHTCDTVKIIANTVRDCGGGIIVRSRNTKVLDNHVYGTKTTVRSAESYAHGIYIGDRSTWWGVAVGGYDLDVRGNLIDVSNTEWATDATGVSGIYCTAALAGARIVGNKIRGFTKHGIFSEGNFGVDVSINDNYIDCTSQVGTIGTTQSYGIMLSPGHAESGNVEANPTGQHNNYTRATITDNVITAPLYAGIRIKGGESNSTPTDEIRISRNTIYGVASNVAGVWLADNYFGSSIEVILNRFPAATGTLAQAIVLNGTSSFYAARPKTRANDVGGSGIRLLTHGEQLGGPLRSGLWYSPQGYQNGTAAMTAGDCSALPFFFSRGVTVAAMGVNLTALGAAASVIRFGIAADVDDLAGGYPDALVGEAGTAAADAATGLIQATTPIVIPKPGLYWLLIAAQGGAPTVSTLQGPNQIVGYQTAGAVSTRNCYRQSGVTAALPANFSTSVNAQGSAPALQFKVT